MGSRSGETSRAGIPAGMDELGVIVVTQDLIEMTRSGPVRIDVRVRIINRPARNLGKNFVGR